MGCRPAFAATQVNLFEGTCYLTPVLGAWLADAHWGRYKTILVFSGIYFVVRTLCCKVFACLSYLRLIIAKCKQGLQHASATQVFEMSWDSVVHQLVTPVMLQPHRP